MTNPRPVETVELTMGLVAIYLSRERQGRPGRAHRQTWTTTHSLAGRPDRGDGPVTGVDAHRQCGRGVMTMVVTHRFSTLGASRVSVSNTLRQNRFRFDSTACDMLNSRHPPFACRKLPERTLAAGSIYDGFAVIVALSSITAGRGPFCARKVLETGLFRVESTQYRQVRGRFRSRSKGAAMYRHSRLPNHVVCHRYRRATSKGVGALAYNLPT